MSTHGSRPWVVGGLVVALVLAAVTWFLLISPTRSTTATLREDRASVQQQNEILVAKTNQLRERDANRAELEAAVRQALAALPDDVSLPDFNRELSLHAQARGVELSSISVGAAAAPAPTITGAAAPAGALAVPITIQTRGPALSQLYFLRDVQEVGPRAALVSSASLSALESGSVVDGATLTTQLTIFSASLSDRDRKLLAEVLGDDLTSG